MLRSVAVASLVLFAATGARAQTVSDEGQWFSLTAVGKLDDVAAPRLRGWFDGHARFFDDTGGFAQSIVRPGIGFAVTDESILWVGYGWIHTRPLSGGGFDENRVWQQWTWSRSCAPFAFGLRSRLEQRFVETGSDTGWRFRQQVRAQYDLPVRPSLSLVAWDELFVDLNDTDWGAERGFDQNRLFVGVGWEPHPACDHRIEVGYLNQVVEVPTGADRDHHILSVNYFVSY